MAARRVELDQQQVSERQRVGRHADGSADRRQTGSSRRTSQTRHRQAEETSPAAAQKKKKKERGKMINNNNKNTPGIRAGKVGAFWGVAFHGFVSFPPSPSRSRPPLPICGHHNVSAATGERRPGETSLGRQH